MEVLVFLAGCLVADLRDEIVALRSRPEGWRSHPEEVLLGCNDEFIIVNQRFLNY